MGMDNKITVETLAAMMTIFGNVCQFCGNEIGADFDGLKLDAQDISLNLCHIELASKGGAYAPANLFPGHGICNRSQNNFAFDYYFTRFACALKSTAADIRAKAAKVAEVVENIKADRIGETERAALKLAYAMRETSPAFFSYSNKRMTPARFARIERNAKS